MVAWFVLFSLDSRPPTHCRHVTKISSRNSFSIPNLQTVTLATPSDLCIFARFLREKSAFAKPAGWGLRYSHCGTQLFATTNTLPYLLPLISFPFRSLRTLLRSRRPQLFCFQPLPHSSPKTTRGGGIPFK